MTHASELAPPVADANAHATAHAHDAPVSAISRSRLEFLFDGVFAIAMTILVLELRVPDLVNHRSSAELARGLSQYASTFGSYLLSFFVLGSFWYRHNHQYRYFHTITVPILVLHFIQLAAAAFFPFCAALFGRYPFNPLSAAIYVGCVLTFQLATILAWVVGRRVGAMTTELSDETYRRTLRRTLRQAVLAAGLLVFYTVKLTMGASAGFW
jgi:uncharacterized membrane protein